MSIKRRTETKTIERDIDLAPDPDDEGRNEALESGLLDVTPQFDGMDLRPVSAGTVMLMQRSGNKLFYGDTSNALADVAAFVLIHSELTSHDARRAIYAKDDSFDEMVFQFLDEPGIQQKITDFTPVISQMMEDYVKTQTVAMGTGTAGAGKKSGRRTG
jgi:pyruvate dehydrogenase complex dehydrogenase (E1) component